MFETGRCRTTREVSGIIPWKDVLKEAAQISFHRVNLAFQFGVRVNIYPVESKPIQLGRNHFWSNKPLKRTIGG
jgi:hypothetical protein